MPTPERVRTRFLPSFLLPPGLGRSRGEGSRGLPPLSPRVLGMDGGGVEREGLGHQQTL